MVIMTMCKFLLHLPAALTDPLTGQLHQVLSILLWFSAFPEMCVCFNDDDEINVKLCGTFLANITIRGLENRTTELQSAFPSPLG